MVPRPLSPYAVAKLAGEHYLPAFHALYGLETVALRYFNVFGPRQDPQLAVRGGGPELHRRALAGRPPVGLRRRRADARFLLRRERRAREPPACTAPRRARRGVQHRRAAIALSVLELWERIGALTGATVKPSHEPSARAMSAIPSLCSITRAPLLEWAPTITLDEGSRARSPRCAAIGARRPPARLPRRSARGRREAAGASRAASSCSWASRTLTPGTSPGWRRRSSASACSPTRKAR